ncbi:spore-associated protein [Actinoplanes sp. TBRC 11911]|uniref:spore-associated protein n=1 Tax=Actinoplanes sp. TBRC 11911 TaxID=2729386 RepID=UPI00145DD7FA|nr:spore-associated protein [Actinoplanes sp. TBRC 11911]NMO49795.1 spore-associated protein [Actinoplanes sp. TBRC 11911]
MKTIIGRVAAAGAALVAAATALTAGPGAAYASDVNPYSASALCGSGYKVVASHGIEGALYTYLLYNSSNGNNCAVTLKQKNFTTKDTTDVYILSQDTHQSKEDFKPYTSYAGPIYMHAPGECVKFGGQVMYGNLIYKWDSDWVACD